MNADHDFDLHHLYSSSDTPIQPPPSGLMKRLTTGIAGKIVMGTITTMVGSMILHSAWLWSMITIICAFIASFGENSEKIKKKVDVILNPPAESASENPGEGGSHTDGEESDPEENEDAKPKKKSIWGKIEEKAKEPTVRIVRTADKVKDDLEGKADEVKESIDKMGQRMAGVPAASPHDAIAIPGSMPPPTVGGGFSAGVSPDGSFGMNMDVNPGGGFETPERQGFGEMLGALPPGQAVARMMGNPDAIARAEASEREDLLAQAAQNGLEADDDCPIEKLRVDVKAAIAARNNEKQAAFREWWARYSPSNAKCPYCRTPMKVRPKGDGYVGCPNVRCRQNFKASQARRMGGQSPPMFYPPEFNVWWSDRLAAKGHAKPTDDDSAP